MENNLKKKRKGKMLAIFIAIIAIVSLFKACSNKNENDKATTSNIKQSQDATPSTDLAIDEYLKQLKLGVKNVNNSIDSTGYLLIEIKYTDSSKEHIANKCYHVLKDLKEHKDYTKIKKVGIMIKADFKDKYGNLTEEKSFSADFDKSELDKVNWDNFSWKNTLDLSNDVWMHPTIN